MEVAEEDNVPFSKRQAIIQAIMRNTSLAPQEKQNKIQQIMAEGGNTEESAEPKADAPPVDNSNESPLSVQDQCELVMMDPSLSMEDKQTKIREIMKNRSSGISGSLRFRWSGASRSPLRNSGTRRLGGSRSPLQKSARSSGTSLTRWSGSSRSPNSGTSSTRNSARSSGGSRSPRNSGRSPRRPGRKFTRNQRGNGTSAGYLSDDMSDFPDTTLARHSGASPAYHSLDDMPDLEDTSDLEDTTAPRSALKRTTSLPIGRSPPKSPVPAAKQGPSKQQLLKEVMEDSSLSMKEKQDKVRKIMTSGAPFQHSPLNNSRRARRQSMRNLMSSPMTKSPSPRLSPNKSRLSPNRSRLPALDIEPKAREALRVRSRRSRASRSPPRRSEGSLSQTGNPPRRSTRNRRSLSSDDSISDTISATMSDSSDTTPSPIAMKRATSLPVGRSPARSPVPAKQDLVNKIMNDSSLSMKEKLDKVLQITAASGAPFQNSPLNNSRWASSPMANRQSHLSLNRSRLPEPPLEEDDLIRDVMIDTSLTLQERQQKVIDLMARRSGKSPEYHSLDDFSELEDSDLEDAKAPSLGLKRTTSLPIRRSAPKSPVPAGEEGPSKQELVKEVMEDSSLSMKEKQDKLRKIMASGAPFQHSPLNNSRRARRQSMRNLVASPMTRQSRLSPNRPSLLEPPLAQDANYLDYTSTPKEKQSKVQQIVAKGGKTEECTNQKPDATPADGSTEPPLSVQDQCKVVMKDPSLTMEEKQSKIREIMKNRSSGILGSVHSRRSGPSRSPLRDSGNSPTRGSGRSRSPLQNSFRSSGISPTRWSGTSRSPTRNSSAGRSGGSRSPRNSGRSPRKPGRRFVRNQRGSGTSAGYLSDDVSDFPDTTLSRHSGASPAYRSLDDMPDLDDSSDLEDTTAPPSALKRTTSLPIGRTLSKSPVPAGQEGPSKQDLVKEVMENSSLSMKEKQDKVRKIMASGAPFQHSPLNNSRRARRQSMRNLISSPMARSTRLSPNKSRLSKLAREGDDAKQKSERDLIRDVMRDTSLTPKEKQQKVKDLMVRYSAQASLRQSNSRRSLQLEAYSTPVPSSPLLGAPSLSTGANSSVQSQGMRKSIPSPGGTRISSQVPMQSPGTGIRASTLTVPPPPPLEEGENEGASEEMSPIPVRQDLIRQVMRDPSLTLQERQQKVRDLMASSAPQNGMSRRSLQEHVGGAALSTGAVDPAALEMSTPPLLISPSGRNKPSQPRMSLQSPMQSPGQGRRSLRPPPAPAIEEVDDEDGSPKLTRQAMIKQILKDPSLTPKEKQQKVKNIMSQPSVDGGGSRHNSRRSLQVVPLTPPLAELSKHAKPDDKVSFVVDDSASFISNPVGPGLPPLGGSSVGSSNSRSRLGASSIGAVGASSAGNLDDDARKLQQESSLNLPASSAHHSRRSLLNAYSGHGVPPGHGPGRSQQLDAMTQSMITTVMQDDTLTEEQKQQEVKDLVSGDQRAEPSNQDPVPSAKQLQVGEAENNPATKEKAKEEMSVAGDGDDDDEEADIEANVGGPDPNAAAASGVVTEEEVEKEEKDRTRRILWAGVCFCILAIAIVAPVVIFTPGLPWLRQ